MCSIRVRRETVHAKKGLVVEVKIYEIYKIHTKKILQNLFMGYKI